ncbi:hypothetical protein [Nocardia sp. NPDC004711]
MDQSGAGVRTQQDRDAMHGAEQCDRRHDCNGRGQQHQHVCVQHGVGGLAGDADGCGGGEFTPEEGVRTSVRLGGAVRISRSGSSAVDGCAGLSVGSLSVGMVRSLDSIE